jgi:hypothetical protein
MPIWAAYGLALLLAIQPTDAGALRLGVIGGLFVFFLLARWLKLGWWGILGLVVAGVALRLGVENHRASDVLDVTEAAIRQAIAGFNPYGHGYEASRPPGAPFPYGPVNLLWYLPGVGDPREIELYISCLILAMFAVRGRPIGLAAYAMAPTVILTAADGSNDTSAGFLLLVALVVAAKRPAIGGILLAIAVGFKPYALAWAPALFAYGGLPAFLGFGLASAAIWVPAFWIWGADNYLISLHGADLAHRATYWSVGVIYEALTQHFAPHTALDQFRLGVAAVVTVAGLFVAKSIDRVIVVGTIVFVVMMFGGFWGSYAYLGAIAPVICWRLDDWLRVPAPDVVASKPWAPAAAATAADDAIPAGDPGAVVPVDGPQGVDPAEPIPPTDGSQPAPPPAPGWSTRTVARS